MIVGISTKDHVRAKQWCIDATLAGYRVHAHTNKNGVGFRGVDNRGTT